MLPFSRAQLHKLPLQGNLFRSKLTQANSYIPKASNKPFGISKSPGLVQYFSSWRGRPFKPPSAFGRRYNTFGSKIDNIDPDRLVYGIIGVNLAIFGCIQFALMERDPYKQQKIRRFIHDNLAFSNLNLKAGRLWTIVTAGFTHEDFWHLLFNSMTIYFFGPTLAASLGNRRFLWLYMLSGISANVLTSIYHKTSRNQLVTPTGITRGDLISSIGASGHTMGMLAYFGLRFPFETIYIYFIPLPAFLVVSGCILYDVVRSRRPATFNGTQINHTAHIGGALFGAMFFFLTRRPSKLLTPRWRGRR